MFRAAPNVEIKRRTDAIVSSIFRGAPRFAIWNECSVNDVSNMSFMIELDAAGLAGLINKGCK